MMYQMTETGFLVKYLCKMDINRRHIILFVLLHQIMCRAFLILCLLTRHRRRLRAKRRRQPRRTPASYSLTQRINAQMNHLHRIADIGDVQCVVNLRMNRNAFARLCYLLTNVGGLVESRYVRIEEKVAMFLSILAHHKKNRVTGHDYIRSGHTVSTHFHDVLHSILNLHPLLLVKPVPVDESCTNEPWKWFKGCLGALDGTYINVHVPTQDKPKYRTRKGTISVNVLGVCNREMNFIYALTGWEGSAADARVLRDALTRDDTLKVPRGCYYLCDNGYANADGFLTPYRRVRYHRDAWGNRAVGPQNYKELYNFRHSQARNVIERAFGLLKKRWAILRSPSFYHLKTQNRIIMACMLLHNFIRSQMPDDPVEEVEDEVVSPTHDIEDDLINHVDPSDSWETWRQDFAMSMWNTY